MTSTPTTTASEYEIPTEAGSQCCANVDDGGYCLAPATITFRQPWGEITPTCAAHAAQFVPCGCVDPYECEHAWCDTHGEVTLTDAGTSTGYAGGTVYFATYSCGCTDIDTTRDEMAAF